MHWQYLSTAGAMQSTGREGWQGRSFLIRASGRGRFSRSRLPRRALLELYGLNDPLGVRGRLGLFYARPTFKRAIEVETAANAIAPQRRGLEIFFPRVWPMSR